MYIACYFVILRRSGENSYCGMGRASGEPCLVLRKKRPAKVLSFTDIVFFAVGPPRCTPENVVFLRLGSFLVTGCRKKPFRIG
jgi:hypothetical protein